MGGGRSSSRVPEEIPPRSFLQIPLRSHRPESHSSLPGSFNPERPRDETSGGRALDWSWDLPLPCYLALRRGWGRQTLCAANEIGFRILGALVLLLHRGTVRMARAQCEGRAAGRCSLVSGSFFSFLWRVSFLEGFQITSFWENSIILN